MTEKDSGEAPATNVMLPIRDPRVWSLIVPYNGTRYALQYSKKDGIIKSFCKVVYVCFINWREWLAKQKIHRYFRPQGERVTE